MFFSSGHVEIAKALVDHGAEMSSVPSGEFKVIHTISRWSSQSVVSFFVSYISLFQTCK